MQMIVLQIQEKPEVSLLEDMELVMQGQLQKKRKVKIEQDGVGTAQGCLPLPTCKLSLVPVPWGEWSAQNLWYFNPLSEHCPVVTSQELSGVVFSSVVFCCACSSCQERWHRNTFSIGSTNDFCFTGMQMNDKGDLTSAIKYSFSLTLSKLHSGALLSPAVSEYA